MAAQPEVLLRVYCDGNCYSFVHAGADGRSLYGGPLERKVRGQAFGPHRLHQVAELSGSSVPMLSQLYVFGLVLIYGFRFDGCVLKYRFSTSDIEVIELTPDRSSDDWPYRDYPALLPYVPIDAVTPQVSTWEEFANQFPNMPEEQPAQLVAVAEPPFTLGFSMWGRGGDLEGVSVVFECDLDTNTVVSYNVCS